MKKIFLILIASGVFLGCSKDKDDPTNNNLNNNNQNNTAKYEFQSVKTTSLRVYSKTNFANDNNNYLNFNLPAGTEEVIYTINSSPEKSSNNIGLFGQVIGLVNPVAGAFVKILGSVQNTGTGSTFSYSLYPGTVRKDDLGSIILDGDGNTRYSVSNRSKTGFPMYGEYIKSDKATFKVSSTDPGNYGFYVENQSETVGTQVNIEITALVRKK